jgi:hypothetical protein
MANSNRQTQNLYDKHCINKMFMLQLKHKAILISRVEYFTFIYYIILYMLKFGMKYTVYIYQKNEWTYHKQDNLKPKMNFYNKMLKTWTCTWKEFSYQQTH